MALWNIWKLHSLKFPLLPINVISKLLKTETKFLVHRKFPVNISYNFLLFNLWYTFPSCCHSLTSQAIDNGHGVKTTSLFDETDSNPALPFINFKKKYLPMASIPYLRGNSYTSIYENILDPSLFLCWIGMENLYVINYDGRGLEFLVYILTYPCLRLNEWYLFTEDL